MLSPSTEVPLNNKRIVKKLRLDLLPFLLKKKDEESKIHNSGAKIPFKNNTPRVNSPIFTIKGESLLRRVGNLQFNTITQGVLASPPCHSARTHGSKPIKTKVVQSPLMPLLLHESESMIYENNETGFSNYNIKCSITRTDPIHQLNLDKIKQRRAQRDKPSLSVALISRNIIKTRISSSQNYLQQLSARTGQGTLTSYQIDNSPINHMKTPLSTRIRPKLYDKPSSSKKKPKKDKKEKKARLQDKNIFDVLKLLHNEQKNEMNQNKKILFHKLKIDIKKNEMKVKNILDDLKRTQIINDEDLKKKKFITKPTTTIRETH